VEVIVDGWSWLAFASKRALRFLGLKLLGTLRGDAWKPSHDGFA